MSAVPRPASVACAVAVVLALGFQAFSEDTLLTDACYLGVLVAASGAAWVGVARRPRSRRLVPSLIAAGLSLNAAGEVVFSAFDRAGLQPDVSIADLAWFACYVLLCLALWVVLTRSRTGGRTYVSFVLDAVTIVVISVLAFWRLTVDAIVADTTVSPFVRAVWASYPVLDAVLLALVVHVLLSRSARTAIGAWFGAGVCLWLTADILYLQAPEDQAAMTIMNAAWMLAPVLMARAAWSDAGDRSEDAPSTTVPANWLVQLLIAVCPLIVPALLELISDVRGQTDRPWQLLIGMAAVMALAFVRTGRLILSEQRALHELQVARDAALAASEAKSMFLANMSHEIRTPLTGVLSTGELLKDTPVDEFQLKLLGMMERSGQRLLTLVEGLLDFSRIEAGHTVVRLAEFDLPAAVTELTEAYLPRATAQGTELDWTLDPRVPHVVVGDRTRVVQVLDNLVNNALKFTEDGRVHLSVRPIGGDGGTPSDGVEFSVTDTGIGIRHEDQASVFESFSQVDGSATRHYQGTGLGLAICKELAELMGGTISVRSQIGVGSTFVVRLPLTPPNPPNPPTTRDDADAEAPHHGGSVQPSSRPVEPVREVSRATR